MLDKNKMKEMENKRGNLKKAVVWVGSTEIAVLVLYPFLARLAYYPQYVYRALTWGDAGVNDY